MTLADLLGIIEPSLAGMEPTCSLNEAVRLVHAAIVDRLILARSESLVEEISVDLAAGDVSAALPVEFISMAQRPSIVGGGYLNMLTSNDTSMLVEAATPRYYKVLGKTLLVYPPCIAEITIKMLASVRPAVPMDFDDVFPFNGEMDQVYVDGVLAVLTGGVKNLVTRWYVPNINAQVDQIVTGKRLADEQVMADTINGL